MTKRFRKYVKYIKYTVASWFGNSCSNVSDRLKGEGSLAHPPYHTKRNTYGRTCTIDARWSAGVSLSGRRLAVNLDCHNGLLIIDVIALCRYVVLEWTDSRAWTRHGIEPYKYSAKLWQPLRAVGVPFILVYISWVIYDTDCTYFIKLISLSICYITTVVTYIIIIIFRKVYLMNVYYFDNDVNGYRFYNE